jgi:hypothetical protein
MIPIELIALVVISKHRGVEDLGNVAKAGDFVGSGTFGEELAVAGPEGFFEGEETLALYVRAFYLAVVYGGVYGVACILRR